MSAPLLLEGGQVERVGRKGEGGGAAVHREEVELQLSQLASGTLRGGGRGTFEIILCFLGKSFIIMCYNYIYLFCLYNYSLAGHTIFHGQKWVGWNFFPSAHHSTHFCV